MLNMEGRFAEHETAGFSAINRYSILFSVIQSYRHPVIAAPLRAACIILTASEGMMASAALILGWLTAITQVEFIRPITSERLAAILTNTSAQTVSTATVCTFGSLRPRQQQNNAFHNFASVANRHRLNHMRQSVNIGLLTSVAIVFCFNQTHAITSDDAWSGLVHRTGWVGLGHVDGSSRTWATAANHVIMKRVGEHKNVVPN